MKIYLPDFDRKIPQWESVQLAPFLSQENIFVLETDDCLEKQGSLGPLVQKSDFDQDNKTLSQAVAFVGEGTAYLASMVSLIEMLEFSDYRTTPLHKIILAPHLIEER